MAFDRMVSSSELVEGLGVVPRFLRCRTLLLFVGWTVAMTNAEFHTLSVREASFEFLREIVYLKPDKRASALWIWKSGTGGHAKTYRKRQEESHSKDLYHLQLYGRCLNLGDVYEEEGRACVTIDNWEKGRRDGSETRYMSSSLLLLSSSS